MFDPFEEAEKTGVSLCYTQSADSHHPQILLHKAWISVLCRRSEDNLHNLCTRNGQRGRWSAARTK